MYKIGLTGGIASGKSTVADILRGLGAPVIDADRIAREIMLPGTPAYKDVVAGFGPDMVDASGQIDRQRLGDIVFKDPAKRLLLNRITHPRVMEEFKNHTEKLPPGTRVVVWDVPLLIETGMSQSVDEVWLVWVDEKTQKRRLMERNGLSEEEAASRIASQMPLEEKMKQADRLIDNRGPVQETKGTVTRYFNQLLRIVQT